MKKFINDWVPHFCFALIVLLTVCLIIFSWYGLSRAVTQEDFTLTVLKDGNPVREFSSQVAIPFNTEFKLRLKNNNHRRCSATIWIDGAKVSEMGEFIIRGNDKLDLERFLNESLTEGKRFKFVPLSHPDVDDPNRVENGIIKVEFRLERLQEIMPKEWHWIENGRLWILTNTDVLILDEDMWLITSGFTDLSQSQNNILPDASFTSALSIGSDMTSTSTLCSNTSAGATIPGSYSNQSFYKVDFDGGDEVVVIQLRMVGI